MSYTPILLLTIPLLLPFLPLPANLTLPFSHLSAAILYHLGTHNPNPHAAPLPPTTASPLEKFVTSPSSLAFSQAMHYLAAGLSLYQAHFTPATHHLRRPPLRALPLALAIPLASALRLASYAALAENYTYALLAPTRIVTTGPYARLAHPGYLSVLVLVAACSAWTGAGFAAVPRVGRALGWAWAVGFSGVMAVWTVGRLKNEEEVLRGVEGWEEYRKGVWGLVPGIW